jgi:hypothetical protein
MTSHHAPGDALAKGCLILVMAVVALFLVVRCTAVHHHDHDRDQAHTQSVAEARAFADRLARAKGATLSARAATAAAHHKEITVRAVNRQTVTIEISTLYGGSALGAYDLTTCFRVEPPPTRPAEADCPPAQRAVAP